MCTGCAIALYTVHRILCAYCTVCFWKMRWYILSTPPLLDFPQFVVKRQMRKVHQEDGQCAECISRKCVGTSFGFSSGTGGAVKIAQSQVVHKCTIHCTQYRGPSIKEKDHLAVKRAQSQAVHNCTIHYTQSRSPSTKEKDHLAVKIA